jgi:hypothetical protein
MSNLINKKSVVRIASIGLISASLTGAGAAAAFAMPMNDASMPAATPVAAPLNAIAAAPATATAPAAPSRTWSNTTTATTAPAAPSRTWSNTTTATTAPTRAFGGDYKAAPAAAPFSIKFVKAAPMILGR